MGVATELATAWARGVAANPTAPADVLMRLLDLTGEAAWDELCGGRTLPDEVVTAIVAGAHPRSKLLLASNPYATPEQRGRLATDPHAMVRLAVAKGPKRGTWRVQPLPDAVIEVFYTAGDRTFPPGLVTADEIRTELEFSSQIPPGFNRGLIAHPDPELRRRVAWDWDTLTPEEQAVLLADPAPLVREEVERGVAALDPVANEALLPDHWTHGRTYMMMYRPMTRAVAERELHDEWGRRTLAYNRYTPADVVERLARDPDPHVRAKVATRYGLPPELRAELEKDPDDEVRALAAAFGAATTKAQHLMLLKISPHNSCPPPLPNPAAYDDPGDPGWYAAAAESANVHLRRAAARHPRLPQDQVRRLASDPDWDVKVLLADHHPGAPPELMLEVFIAEPRQRARRLHHPWMPRTGLAHLLDYPDPEVRALAVADPTLPEPPIAQLDDADPTVRRTAAAHPLLPGETVDRLLRDPRHAEGAAANPRLDVETLHGLLDDAGIPRRLPGHAAE